MSDRPCMLNPLKWRVARYTVETAVDTVATPPWQGLLKAVKNFQVWGIWPPQWDIEEDPPLLIFPLHQQAFRAAFDRAQFAAVPPNRRQHGQT